MTPAGEVTAESGPRQVRVLCSLSLPAGATVPAGVPVTVHLAVLDVSLADTAATPVGRTDVEVTDASSLPGPYRLEATLTPGRHFAVTAHVDLGGDGAVSSGDLLSTTRVAVPTDRDAVVLDVPVTLID